MARAILLMVILSLEARPPAVLPPRLPLSDLHRFPPREYVQDMLAFSERYIDYLLGQWAILPHQREGITLILQDAREARYPWQLLSEAYAANGSDANRQDVLRLLRDEIGPAAYNLGTMPSAIPLHHFTRLP